MGSVAVSLFLDGIFPAPRGAWAIMRFVLRRGRLSQRHSGEEWPAEWLEAQGSVQATRPECGGGGCLTTMRA